MNCLLCKRDVTGIEDYCATRREDGEKVCPDCTQKIRNGNRDALNQLHDARPIHGR